MLSVESLASQMAAAEPWPENASLYQLPTDQILLSDAASCLAVQTFLKMCNLPVLVVYRTNAESMSPSGEVPFIHAGNHVVSELGPIVQFVRAKGHSLSESLDEQEKAEMKAYMELVNSSLLTAEMCILWCDKNVSSLISRPRYGSPFPFPLDIILARQKQREIVRRMKAVDWAEKTREQIHDEVDQSCRALSQRLGNHKYFFESPTELDALVFGHLYSLLTTDIPGYSIPEIIRNYPNLTNFCKNIDAHYFSQNKA
uniref:metaxin-2-like n=1 Tax=Myxine glutinosa TaxID=7769 RepID=UPI00358F9DE0